MFPKILEVSKINKLVLKLIFLYQKFLSPLKKPCCRFYPTCSKYAKTAFLRYGFFKALFLSLKRFLRCNPFFKGGFDPVPEGETKKGI